MEMPERVCLFKLKTRPFQYLANYILYVSLLRVFGVRKENRNFIVTLFASFLAINNARDIEEKHVERWEPVKESHVSFFFSNFPIHVISILKNIYLYFHIFIFTEKKCPLVYLMRS